MKRRRDRFIRSLTESVSIRRPDPSAPNGILVDNTKSFKFHIASAGSLLASQNYNLGFQVNHNDYFAMPSDPIVANSLHFSTGLSSIRVNDQLVRWDEMEKVSDIPTGDELKNATDGVLTITRIDKSRDLQLFVCKDITARL